MDEKCNTCQTPLRVARNKRNGHFVVCPNKEKHASGFKFDGTAEPPKPAPKPDNPPQKTASHRTAFGW